MQAARLAAIKHTPVPSASGPPRACLRCCPRCHRLDSKQALIVSLRHGLHDGRAWSCKEIGERLDCTGELEYHSPPSCSNWNLGWSAHRLPGTRPAAGSALAQLLTPHCPTLCPPYAAAWVAAQYKMAAHKLQRQASGAEDAAPAQLGASQALTAAIARCRGYPFRGCPRCARCLCCAVPLVCPSCCPDMRRLRSLDICLQAEPGRAAGPGAALGLAGWQAVDVCRNWEAHERQQ